MRVLVLHNRYQQAGGEDRVMENEVALLRNGGCEVEVLEEDNEGIGPVLTRIGAAVDSVYSRRSHRRVDERLKAFQPDVVHVHNFFPRFSPSIYYATAKAGVPVVQTLHNYRFLCPNGILFRDGKPCEDCLDKSFAWPGVMHGCYRGSRLGSLAVATMSATHRALGTWSRKVDRYICLTEFSRGKFLDAGFPEDKLVVKPNFVAPDPHEGDGDGGFAIFVGRLTPEKGVPTLLKAWKQAKTPLWLKLAGDGPLRAQVEVAAAEDYTIEYVGPQPPEKLYPMIGAASFLVLSSECYENFPLVIAEAFACGTPVIASKLGAVAELVADGRTGLYFTPDDAGDLAAKLAWAAAHPAELRAMRKAARAEYLAKYTAERNYSMLMSIYAGALRGKGARESELAAAR